MTSPGYAKEEAEGGMVSVVEFKEDVERPTGGRRAKAEKDRKRKMKPGSFGEQSIALQALPSRSCRWMARCSTQS